MITFYCTAHRALAETLRGCCEGVARVLLTAPRVWRVSLQVIDAKSRRSVTVLKGVSDPVCALIKDTSHSAGVLPRRGCVTRLTPCHLCSRCGLCACACGWI